MQHPSIMLVISFFTGFSFSDFRVEIMFNSPCFDFIQVIEYATAYKTILTAIKKEYDSFISAIMKSDCKAKLAQGKLKARVAQPTSLMYCQRRAFQLQERQVRQCPHIINLCSVYPCIKWLLLYILLFFTEGIHIISGEKTAWYNVYPPWNFC